MKLLKFRIGISLFLIGLILLSPIFATYEAKASDIPGLSNAQTCPELDTIEAALAGTQDQPEFNAVRAVVVAKKAQYAATNQLSNISPRDITSSASSQFNGTLGTIGGLLGNNVPVDIKNEAQSAITSHEVMANLTLNVLQSAQKTQKATGDPRCAGMISDVLDALEKAANAAVTATNKATGVSTILKFLDTLGGSALSITGGGTPNIGRSATGVGDVVNAKKDLLGVDLAIKIYTKELEIMQKAGSSVLTADVLASRKAKLDSQLHELNAREQTLKQLADAKFVDYLKAAAVAFGKQALVSAANNFIPKMIKQFGLTSVYEQTRALAKNVYGLEYIRQNYSGDPEKALITKYLMDAAYNYEPGKIKTAQAAIEAQAARVAGPACNSPNINSQTFMFDMQKCGTMKANPLYLSSEAQQAANAGVAAAEASATLEVTQNGGANSIRNYNQGSVEQQNTIDAQNAQLAAQLKLAKDTLDFAKKGGNADAIKQAQAAFEAADLNYQKNLKTLPDGPVKLLFQGITTPGPLLAKFITDKGLSAMINTDHLDPNNLPFAVSSLSKFFGDMVGKWITGEKPNLNLGTTLKNAVFASITPGIQAIASSVGNSGPNITGSQFNQLIIYTAPQGSDSPKNEVLTPGRTYDLVVDFSAIKGVDLKQIKVVGFSAGTNVETLSPADITAGKIRIPFDATSSPASFTVHASIYGESGGALVTSDSLTIKQGSGGNGGGVEPTPQPGQIIAVKYPAPNEERFKLKWNLTAVGGTAQALVVSGPNLIDSSGHGFDKLTLGRDKFTGTLDIIPPPTGSADYKFSFYQNLQDINNNVPPISVKTYYFPEGVVQGAYTFKIRGPAVQKIR